MSKNFLALVVFFSIIPLSGWVFAIKPGGFIGDTEFSVPVKTLRGMLMKIDTSKIHTSVGDYSLATTKVLDKRQNSEAEDDEVLLQISQGTLVEVYIYDR